ncbi:MAG: hypothetical protein ABIF82_00685 [Planctomycetota bacterium]
MPRQLDNPYRDASGKWIRGSFHGHCSEHSGCSSVPLAESVRRYHELGVGFVAVTDHDWVTDLAAMRAAYPALVFLEGFEYSRGENVAFVGPGAANVLELPLKKAMAAAGDLLTILCHPRPVPGGDYWTLRKINRLMRRMPDGIEVYNGHYGVPQMIAAGRRPLYSGFWDELLTAGRRVWGFANDDFHDPADFDNAFNMVLVDDATAASIIGAAKRGRSYASTGLLLDRIDESAGRIVVATAGPCIGRFIGPGGRVLSQCEGTRFEHTHAGEAYVRFEAEAGQRRLFLQPMFICSRPP